MRIGIKSSTRFSSINIEAKTRLGMKSTKTRRRLLQELLETDVVACSASTFGTEEVVSHEKTLRRISPKSGNNADEFAEQELVGTSYWLKDVNDDEYSNDYVGTPYMFRSILVEIEYIIAIEPKVNIFIDGKLGCQPQVVAKLSRYPQFHNNVIVKDHGNGLSTQI